MYTEQRVVFCFHFIWWAAVEKNNNTFILNVHQVWLAVYGLYKKKKWWGGGVPCVELKIAWARTKAKY